MSRDKLNAGDFLQGQLDCQKGKPHAPGKSKDYDRGYRAQYEWEQVQTELSLRNQRGRA